MTISGLEERLVPIFSRYEGKRGVLVSVLQDVQAELGYLPEEAMRAVSKAFHVPLASLYGVASFYTQFYFEPRGKHVIRVCTGTACHIRGAPAIVARLEKTLGIKAGQTTPDLRFTLETVNCVGCCALAPVVVVDERVWRRRDHPRLFRWIEEGHHESA